MTTKTRNADLRRDPAYMVFWDAINEGRAALGLPEALYFGVRQAWEQAMIPSRAEITAAEQRANA